MSTPSKLPEQVPGFPSELCSVHLYERKKVFRSSQLIREEKKKQTSHLIGGLLSNKFNTLQTSTSAVRGTGWCLAVTHVLKPGAGCHCCCWRYSLAITSQGHGSDTLRYSKMFSTQHPARSRTRWLLPQPFPPHTSPQRCEEQHPQPPRTPPPSPPWRPPASRSGSGAAPPDSLPAGRRGGGGGKRACAKRHLSWGHFLLWGAGSWYVEVRSTSSRGQQGRGIVEVAGSPNLKSYLNVNERLCPHLWQEGHTGVTWGGGGRHLVLLPPSWAEVVVVTLLCCCLLPECLLLQRLVNTVAVLSFWQDCSCPAQARDIW